MLRNKDNIYPVFHLLKAMLRNKNNIYPIFHLLKAMLDAANISSRSLMNEAFGQCFLLIEAVCSLEIMHLDFISYLLLFM